MLIFNANAINPHPRKRPNGVGWFCVFVNPHVGFSPCGFLPVVRRTEPERWCQPSGKFGRLPLRFLHPRSFRESPASPHRREQGTKCSAPGTPRARRVPTPRPRAGAPRLGRSHRQTRAGRALGPAPAPACPHQPPAGASSASLACGRLPPPPSPNQQINTTFYEKKTNFSDVTHLWCSRLLGRESRPGASVVSAERAPQHRTARTRNPHSDTQQRAARRAAAAGATKEPGVRAGSEGACGRVRLRRA